MGPLENVKVLELGQLIAGPFCTRVMADFGAQVIKVVSPKVGDPLRKWRKLYKAKSLWWLLQARNKQSITINLKEKSGQAIVRRLAKEVDVVVENFRPGSMEKWGLDYDSLAKDNPGLSANNFYINANYTQFIPYGKKSLYENGFTKQSDVPTF